MITEPGIGVWLMGVRPCDVQRCRSRGGGVRPSRSGRSDRESAPADDDLDSTAVAEIVGHDAVANIEDRQPLLAADRPVALAGDQQEPAVAAPASDTGKRRATAPPSHDNVKSFVMVSRL